MNRGPFALVDASSEEIYGMGKTRDRAVKQGINALVDETRSEVEALSDATPTSVVAGRQVVLVECKDHVLRMWRSNGYGCATIPKDDGLAVYHADEGG